MLSSTDIGTHLRPQPISLAALLAIALETDDFDEQRAGATKEQHVKVQFFFCFLFEKC